MSHPADQQRSPEPDPWPGQPPMPQQPSPGQDVPPQAYWQPSPPASRQGNGLAITALVVACVALVVVLGLVLLVFIGGFFSSAFSSSGDLQGTAPQVVAGEPYPGSRLADEVSRVISGDGGDVGSMTCPETPVVDAGALAVCHGVVDGSDSTVTVTFEDGLGHFTLAES
jgi:hypothetical protein